MKNLLILTLLAVCSNLCLAGTVTSEVAFVQVNNKTNYPNIVAIKPATMPTGRPSCATDAHGRFAVSLDTEAGKAIYSMALAAQANGRKLTIYGTGNCIGGALEEVNYIRIKE